MRPAMRYSLADLILISIIASFLMYVNFIEKVSVNESDDKCIYRIEQGFPFSFRTGQVELYWVTNDQILMSMMGSFPDEFMSNYIKLLKLHGHGESIDGWYSRNLEKVSSVREIQDERLFLPLSFMWKNLLGNILVSLVILILLAFVSKKFTRRKQSMS